MKRYFLELAKEPSTLRGIIGLLTAAGVTLNPDQVAAIVAAGMGLAGLVGAFLPDKKTDV